MACTGKEHTSSRGSASDRGTYPPVFDNPEAGPSLSLGMTNSFHFSLLTPHCLLLTAHCGSAAIPIA
jgi:hypothetical protein